LREHGNKIEFFGDNMSELLFVLDMHPSWMSPHFINIYLVFRGARNMCMINDVVGDTTALYQYAINLGLEWYGNVFWLVARRHVINEYILRSSVEEPNAVLGELLGYRGYDHQWSNFRRDRLAAFTTISVRGYRPLEIIFMVEEDRTDIEDLYRYLQYRRQTIMDVLPPGTDITISVTKSPSIGRRLAALIYNDVDYISGHVGDYQNDVCNFMDHKIHDRINMMIHAVIQHHAGPDELATLISRWMSIQ
jgi:hypothetical protein